MPSFTGTTAQDTDCSGRIDHDHYPEVIPENLPQEYYEAPQLYQDAPEVWHGSALPEKASETRSVDVSSKWWQRHRKSALACGLVLAIVIVGGAIGGSLAARKPK